MVQVAKIHERRDARSVGKEATNIFGAAQHPGGSCCLN